MGRLTNEDYQVYGGEFLDVAKRAAQEAMGPELEALKQQQQHVAQREQRLTNQLTLNELDEKLPGWRQINTSPAFLEWLQGQHYASGGVKGTLLRQAFASGSASRVIAIFKEFQSESGTAQAPAHWSGGRTQWTGQQQTGTVGPKDVEAFYERVRKGYYNGRDAQKDADERAIHAALHQRGSNR
jgi:hypothetical protein